VRNVVKELNGTFSFIFITGERGGGQEFGLRSGTENLPAIAGLGQAFKTAIVLREKESKRLKIIRDYAVQKILKEIPNTSLNGSLENRLPNNLNICFSHSAKATWDESVLDSEFLVIKLDVLGFAVSAASACHHLNLENGSYVIESLGKKDCAGSSLRITLGRETKKSDLDQLIIALKKIVC
jgi:cysteine desulfurase